MYLLKAARLLLCAPSVVLAYRIKTFRIDLSSRLPHMKTLVRQTKLPNTSVLHDARTGISLPWLKDRQKEWANTYKWETEQAKLNQFNHSTVDVGNMTVHFIHQRSSRHGAIPLLLTHGWPGSFYEFNQVIKPLSNPGADSNTSFHVIVPSLPGFGFSSPAPPNWGLNDTASLFNTLVTDVLGYDSYAAVGGDWGCVVTWGLHNNHPARVKAVLYTGLIPQFAPTLQALLDDPRFADKTSALSSDEKQKLQNNTIFQTDGIGYFIEQATRPSTIGLALYDNPIGQLAWIGQKYLDSSDPQYGVSPSTITNNTILTSISLYYLTGTFETAANIYYQNSNEFQPTMRKAVSQAPMGFSTYRYEIQHYPEFYLREVGNLVFYSEHSRGGHFSALDNPPAYISDIRSMMGQWYKP